MLECVQFHPEASPGPHDCGFIFDRFRDQAAAWNAARGQAKPAASPPPSAPKRKGGDAHAASR
jgi:hypothetical protein